ncbi:MAG: hypothetical protein A4E37_01816 [Methanoregulaceae archaeon PtaB.Bin056]|nr:MAG: hypothetical protein A4E37_01816 [Methanoregulaceae archaeon PtaB.Bin056]
MPGARKSTIASTTTKTAIALYWLLRYTIAPSRIAPAIFCISSVPVPSRFMSMKEYPANTRPSRAQTGTMKNISIPVKPPENIRFSTHTR